MPQPIKVRGRFLTANETAEVLGVPKSRARHLISLAQESLKAAGPQSTKRASLSNHDRSATRATKKSATKASHK